MSKYSIETSTEELIKDDCMGMCPFAKAALAEIARRDWALKAAALSIESVHKKSANRTQ